MASESTVQQAVWHLEVGVGRRIVLWVLVLLLAIGIGVVYTALQFRGLEKREAMDMAQVARNLARGQGYTTYVIRPLSLRQLQEHTPAHEARLMNHPDIYNPPLYPALLAGVFKLLPPRVFTFSSGDRVYTPEQWAILPVNQVCLLLTLLLVYFWARQLFDTRVAITAGLLLLFSDTLWTYSVSGLPTNLLMLLALLAMYCLWLADRWLNPLGEDATARPVDAVVVALLLGSAVLAGLCFLTRYTAGLLVVPVLVYLARMLRGRHAVVWMLVYAAVFLAVITPWLARNVEVSGSPWGIAHYQIAGDEPLQRAYHPELGEAFGVRAVLRQLVTGTRAHLLGSLRMIGTDFLICFFLVGVMYGFRRRDVARLRGVLLGLLFSGMVAMAVFGAPREASGPEIFGGNLLVVWLPLVAVFGTAFFYLLLDRINFQIPLTKGIAIGGFALVNTAPFLFSLLPPHRGPFPYPPYLAPYTAMTAKWFNADEVGASDLPWAMAWSGDRRTLWLPTMVQDFMDINDFVVPQSNKGISFLFLTPYMLNRNYQSEILKGEFKDWAGVIRGQLPASFPLKAVTLFHPNNEQILFADRPRWSAKELAGNTEPPPAQKKPATPAKPAN